MWIVLPLFGGPEGVVRGSVKRVFPFLHFNFEKLRHYGSYGEDMEVASDARCLFLTSTSHHDGPRRALLHDTQ
jgi:hypothetical protein